MSGFLGTPGSSDSSAHLDLRLSVWMFAAGRIVLRFFLGSHGKLGAVSAPLMMPLRDSDIPMNVPFTLRNKQPLTPKNGSRRIPSTPVAQTSNSCNAAVTLPFWTGSRCRGRTTRTIGVATFREAFEFLGKVLEVRPYWGEGGTGERIVLTEVQTAQKRVQW